MSYSAIDLFCGCGGLTQGMRQAGFSVKGGIEIDADAVRTFRANHPRTKVIGRDIRNTLPAEICRLLKGRPLHLLAGCPPCQGFSNVRRLNRKRSIRDRRNELILDYLRFVEELRPLTVMMENVPGIMDYFLFQKLTRGLKDLGYHLEVGIVDVADYGIPQHRKRLILLASSLGILEIAPPIGVRRTVRDAIGQLPSIDKTLDPLHQITAKHTPRIMQMIALVPKDGGSRKDLPAKYMLKCHSGVNVGFNDVYGRLKWDACAGTITGGCLNPSKGRFLHPEQDRVLSPREAALLQSFPADYWFPTDIAKDSIANMIGEALPPEFSRIQSENIKNHLDLYFG